jgi:hypothetical protein
VYRGFITEFSRYPFLINAHLLFHDEHTFAWRALQRKIMIPHWVARSRGKSRRKLV